MPTLFEQLKARIAEAHAEIEADLVRQRAQFNYQISRGRVIFDAEMRRRHRAAREALPTFLSYMKIQYVLAAPFIYGLIVPFALLDLFVAVYQAVCFPLFGLKKVPRRDHVVIDRQHLAYLNALQKVNCVYCGYCNGVLSWVREVAARTEAYWCPIKHAARIPDPHPLYAGFVDFGDVDAFRARVDALRAGQDTPG